MRFTLGTHNTLDGEGRESMFADLLFFTEAALTPRDHARFIARGFGLLECPEQRDLAIAYRRSLFRRRDRIHYHRVVDGVAGVTPNRGTAWLTLEHRATATAIAAVWEHRINAAFPPYVRGEPVFRRKAWHDHTDHTLDLIDRLVTSRYLVLAGGDVNTPDGVRGYWPALERGFHFDRLALRVEPDGNPHELPWSLGPTEYLSNLGSDHPRLRVQVIRTPTR